MRKLVLATLIGAVAALALVLGTVNGQQGPPPGPTPLPTPVFQPPPPPLPPCPPTCPTVTPTATATATPVPLTLNLRLAHHTVNPQSKQKLTVTTLPNIPVTITVKFPDGDGKSHDGTTDTAGKLTWSYIQPGSRITHTSRTGRVSVRVSSGAQVKGSTKPYTIGFARLDISMQPRSVKRGHALTFWLHTSGKTSVELVLTYPHKVTQKLFIYNRNNANRWSSTRYVVPSKVAIGRVDVKGYNLARTYRGSAETSFRVT